jgi:hypothetical protein
MGASAGSLKRSDSSKRKHLIIGTKISIYNHKPEIMYDIGNKHASFIIVTCFSVT